MKLIEDDKEPPSQFYDQPELSLDQVFYWDAFNDLSSERAIGMGIGPIPYSAVRNYAAEFNIVDRDEFDYFYGIMKAMDTEYLTIVNSTEKKETTMVPVSDVAEQHRLFERLKARAGVAKR
jgi:hypothetical protein